MELRKDPHCWPGVPLCCRKSLRDWGCWRLAAGGQEASRNFSLTLPRCLLGWKHHEGRGHRTPMSWRVAGSQQNSDRWMVLPRMCASWELSWHCKKWSVGMTRNWGVTCRGAWGRGAGASEAVSQGEVDISATSVFATGGALRPWFSPEGDSGICGTSVVVTTEGDAAFPGI